eukprot:1770108-Rhodomonas_salina.4
MRAACRSASCSPDTALRHCDAIFDPVVADVRTVRFTDRLCSSRWTPPASISSSSPQQPQPGPPSSSSPST